MANTNLFLQTLFLFPLLLFSIHADTAKASPSLPPSARNPITPRTPPSNTNGNKTPNPAAPFLKHLTLKSFPPYEFPANLTPELDFLTLSTDLDAPKISTITPSTFDWWYFDAVSAQNPSCSVVVTFFAASPDAFPWLVAMKGQPNGNTTAAQQSHVLSAYIWVSFPNGTIFTRFVPATLATVASGGYGSSGIWQGTGMKWAGTHDASKWVVSVDAEEMGIRGSLVVRSTAPVHLPCSLPKPGTVQSLELTPGVGWVNVVPDGDGIVELEVLGEKVEFRGPGYHDKNWSNRPFQTTISSWNWGHGHVGPYSIVWFNAITRSNETYVSSYVAKNGKVITSTCNTTQLTVRPIESFSKNNTGNGNGNGNTTTTATTTTIEGRYPPKAGDYPEGFRLEFALGDEEEGKLNVNVIRRAVVVSDGMFYMRWTGDMEGELVRPGLDGKSDFGGVGVYEQFVLEE